MVGGLEGRELLCDDDETGKDEVKRVCVRGRARLAPGTGGGTELTRDDGPNFLKAKVFLVTRESCGNTSNFILACPTLWCLLKPVHLSPAVCICPGAG